MHFTTSVTLALLAASANAAPALSQEEYNSFVARGPVGTVAGAVKGAVSDVAGVAKTGAALYGTSLALAGGVGASLAGAGAVMAAQGATNLAKQAGVPKPITDAAQKCIDAVCNYANKKLLPPTGNKVTVTENGKPIKAPAKAGGKKRSFDLELEDLD